VPLADPLIPVDGIQEFEGQGVVTFGISVHDLNTIPQSS
jgi:hypothetical protein